MRSTLRWTTTALAFAALAGCGKTHAAAAAATATPDEGPAKATLLFTGDGWGEYAPCG